MPAVVSVVIPIYKRLNYLPGVLQAVARQDYPHVDLIVSDNGGLSERARPIIDQHYPKPYRLRKTPKTLSIAGHFNDALKDAQGEFLVWLCDDDLISPNYLSELVPILQARPDVAVGVARQEVIDEQGGVLRHSSDEVPDELTGEEFIHSWTKYGYECYSTLLTRTKDVREVGGFGEFPHGTAADDALLIRLCFRGSVAFNPRCTFQWRWHETSAGFAIPPEHLAADLRAFLTFLDTHPVVREFARTHPAEWARMKHAIATTTWVTYLNRWKTMYRQRLTVGQWVCAAFGMPFIPRYYRSVGAEFWAALKEHAGSKGKSGTARH
jgi:glycosyltransferase involved in cell wall biosynthesis